MERQSARRAARSRAASVSRIGVIETINKETASVGGFDFFGDTTPNAQMSSLAAVVIDGRPLRCDDDGLDEADAQLQRRAGRRWRQIRLRRGNVGGGGRFSSTNHGPHDSRIHLRGKANVHQIIAGSGTEVLAQDGAHPALKERYIDRIVKLYTERDR